MLVEQYGASVTKVEKFRAPPLHHAAPSGHLDVYNILLNHGANINTVDALGATCFHQACGIQPEVVSLLLQRGADPSFATSMGETPLHSAINSNKAIAINMLLAHGCKADAQGNDQATRSTVPSPTAIITSLTSFSNTVSMLSPVAAVLCNKHPPKPAISSSYPTGPPPQPPHARN